MLTPAFATARSNGPSSDSARRTAAATALASVTSQATATDDVLRLLRTSSSASPRRARSATAHPRRDSSCASDAPIPLDAPVMMAFFGKRRHYLRMRLLVAVLLISAPLHAGVVYDFVTTMETPRYSMQQSGH